MCMSIPGVLCMSGRQPARRYGSTAGVLRLASRLPSSGVQASARSFSELCSHLALSRPAFVPASGVVRLDSPGTGFAGLAQLREPAPAARASLWGIAAAPPPVALAALGLALIALLQPAVAGFSRLAVARCGGCRPGYWPAVAGQQ